MGTELYFGPVYSQSSSYLPIPLIPAQCAPLARIALQTLASLLVKLDGKLDVISVCISKLKQVWMFFKPCIPVVVFVLPFFARALGFGEETKASKGAVMATNICLGLCVFQIGYCFLFYRQESFNIIKVQAGQSVLIRFDARGAKLDVDAFVKQMEGVEEGRFTNTAKGKASALTSLCFLAIPLIGIGVQSQWHTKKHTLLLFVAGASSIFLMALLGQNVHDFAVQAGERSEPGAFIGDVQRQYTRRHCIGSDAVPFFNHSDKAVELCVIFSATRFLGAFRSYPPEIEFKYDVLEAPYHSLMKTFDSILSPHMTHLLSGSSAASRFRGWKLPSLLNFVVGFSCITCTSIFLYCLHGLYANGSVEKFLETFGKLGPLGKISKYEFVKSILKKVFEEAQKLKSFSDSVFKIISIPCECIYSVISILGKFVYNCVISILSEERISKFFRNLQELLQPIFDFFRDRVKRWIIDIIRPSWEFVSSRFKVFVQEDGLQKLYVSKLRASRQQFVELFLERAVTTDFGINGEKFDHVKRQLLEWQKSSGAKYDETLFKALDELWEIWSNDKGQPQLASWWAQVNFFDAIRPKFDGVRLSLLEWLKWKWSDQSIGAEVVETLLKTSDKSQVAAVGIRTRSHSHCNWFSLFCSLIFLFGGQISIFTMRWCQKMRWV